MHGKRRVCSCLNCNKHEQSYKPRVGITTIELIIAELAVEIFV